MEKTEIDENEIMFFLTRLKAGDIEDIKYRRALIAIFINAVYLYDDRATIVFNASDKAVTVDYDIVDGTVIADSCPSGKCSYMKASAPP
ncbi:MAG: hypothetical protein GX250_04495 [Clostridiales bacterium]|nr:hypothetical protein [Clostridiales bacterium]